jgi:hypothetical protein
MNNDPKFASRGLINGGVTTVRPGHLSDGQPHEGLPPENVHHDKRPAYDHRKAVAYREALRERPSDKQPRGK